MCAIFSLPLNEIGITEKRIRGVYYSNVVHDYILVIDDKNVQHIFLRDDIKEITFNNKKI
jgi:hypothetical protein